MSCLFLSHTSIDKPFVEKLASDLNRLGIDTWFDKYEIKVGESIFWKVDEGLRESEYFAIVLSPEALDSEWVRAELATAWNKKMLTGGNAILPILYRDCELPGLLKSIKYANFTDDYEVGFAELARVFGVKNTDAITKDTWRAFIGDKNSNWREYREEEFKEFITGLCGLARKNNFAVWVGGQNKPFSVVISAHWLTEVVSEELPMHTVGFGIRMVPRRQYRYCCAENETLSPSCVPLSRYNTVVASTVNEALEFVSNKMEYYVERFGRPDGRAFYHTERLDKFGEKGRRQLMSEIMRTIDWDQGKAEGWLLQ